MSRDITETNAKAAFSGETRLDMHFSQKHKLLDILDGPFLLVAFFPPDVGRKGKSRGAQGHVSCVVAERNGGPLHESRSEDMCRPT